MTLHKKAVFPFQFQSFFNGSGSRLGAKLFFPVQNAIHNFLGSNYRIFSDELKID